MSKETVTGWLFNVYLDSVNESIRVAVVLANIISVIHSFNKHVLTS